MRIYTFLLAGVTCLSLALLSAATSAAADAKSLYTNRCQGCHGADGKGSPTMAKALQVNIPDLTSKDVGKKPDTELLEALTKGRGKMPPAGGLSSAELKDLVAYVKGLSKGK